MVALDRRVLLEAVEPLCEEVNIEADVLVSEVVIEGLRHRARLICSLLKDAFYKLPDVFVDLEDSPELAGLPHVGNDGKICTFDETESFPDPRRPEETLAISLERAIKVLSDGVSGCNHDDYKDEIVAYWGLQASGFVFVADVPAGEIATMHCAQGSFLGKDCVCVATSRKDAAAFAGKLAGRSLKEKETYPCLFMRIPQPISIPIPETCSRWDEELGRMGLAFVRAYRKHVVDSDRPWVRVLMTVPTGEGEALVSFSQSRAPNLKRFRSNETRYRYAKDAFAYGDTKISRHFTELVSQGRLYARGGNGTVMSNRYAIVGCGSLGSLLSRALADCGADDFVLVDPETLMAENIARHVCGFDHVGESKPNALSKYLQGRNPNVSCEVHLNDANELLDRRPLVFNECDAVFVTAADSPLEYHFVRKILEGTVTVPVVIMWVEPFALAAHALVINSPQDIFSKLYDDDLFFAHPAVSNGLDFLRRESGCQSSFVPYSGIDVQSFVIDFARNLEHLLSDGKNYHFCWIGGVSGADEVGAVIAPEYAVFADYSHTIERID